MILSDAVFMKTSSSRSIRTLSQHRNRVVLAHLSTSSILSRMQRRRERRIPARDVVEDVAPSGA